METQGKTAVAVRIAQSGFPLGWERGCNRGSEAHDSAGKRGERECL